MVHSIIHCIFCKNKKEVNYERKLFKKYAENGTAFLSIIRIIEDRKEIRIFKNGNFVY